MTEKEEKLVTIVAAVFLLISLIAMGCVRVFYKGENTTEVHPQEESIEEEYFVSLQGQEWDIMIPTPYQDGNGLYKIEESIKNRTIEVVMTDLSEDYYYENQIQGNEEKIAQIRYQQDGDENSLRFVLKDIYMMYVREQGGMLCLRLDYPTDIYDSLVVLDGFQSEVSLPELVKQGGYVLKNGDIAVANEVRADYYVGLSLEADENKDSIVIYYNDGFFIPDFDSRNLAEVLQAELAARYGEEQVKLVETDEYGLAEAMLPAVWISAKVYISPETDMRQILKTQGDEIEKDICKVLSDRYQEVEK